jgi:hypothetical protein
VFLHCLELFLQLGTIPRPTTHLEKRAVYRLHSAPSKCAANDGTLNVSRNAAQIHGDMTSLSYLNASAIWQH